MRQFIAVTNSVLMTSGFKNSREDAEKWAQETLHTHGKVTTVTICEAVARVERDSPPTRTIELKHELQDEFNAASKNEDPSLTPVQERPLGIFKSSKVTA